LSEADSQEDLLRQVQILYENPKLLVVFKPRGLMVHPNTHEPGAPNLEGILSGRLHQKIHGIHRLDRGTAGLMVYAKDKETCTAVSEQFAHRQVTKVYKAILSREIPEEILVDSPLRNKPKHRAVPASTTIQPLRVSQAMSIEGYEGKSPSPRRPWPSTPAATIRRANTAERSVPPFWGITSTGSPASIGPGRRRAGPRGSTFSHGNWPSKILRLEKTSPLLQKNPLIIDKP
jgi:hypothetical protein